MSELGVLGPRGHRGALLDNRGQGLVELVITLPILLLLALGLIEVSRAIEADHVISGLTREGANLASRGSTLAEAVTVTRANQAASGLGTDGGVIASRIEVSGGVPRVVAQVGQPCRLFPPRGRGRTRPARAPQDIPAARTWFT